MERKVGEIKEWGVWGGSNTRKQTINTSEFSFTGGFSFWVLMDFRVMCFDLQQLPKPAVVSYLPFSSIFLPHGQMQCTQTQYTPNV